MVDFSGPMSIPGIASMHDELVKGAIRIDPTFIARHLHGNSEAP